MKYKGKYRVLPNTNGNPIPRDEYDNIEKSFDDIYIKCAKNCQIYFIGNGSSNRHKILEFYSPSLSIGRNILKEIYATYVNKFDVSKINFDELVEIDPHISVIKTQKIVVRGDKELESVSVSYKCDIQDIYDQLIHKCIFTKIYESDSEVFAQFDDKLLDSGDLEKYFNPSTNGASISPFSSRNFKKEEYTIPQIELDLYNKTLLDNGVTKESGKLIQIVHINRKFDDYIVNKLGTKKQPYDIKSAKREANIGAKEFIHSIGMWKDYITFLEKEFKNI